MDSTLSAPPIGERIRIPETVIRELARRIAERFHPQRIILFGSYAYGKPRPESDVDLLVVMETPLKESRQALQIRQEISPMFGVDILVYTPQHLGKRISWGDSFLQEILQQGEVLYESSHA